MRSNNSLMENPAFRQSIPHHGKNLNTISQAFNVLNISPYPANPSIYIRLAHNKRSIRL